jgi:VanW like protein
MLLSKSLRQQNIPTLFDNLLFRAKASILQLQRGWQNLRGGQVKWQQQSQLTTSPICARSQTDLWVGATDAEWSLQAGKIHNLRLAIRHINGIEIPAGEIFSFWSQVGQPTVWRGFAVGRELREGCIIPTVGGGLCQLSNALYDAALQSGLEIVERYAHSQVIPGSLAEIGRDATVFWNYIDLKFRSSQDLRIEARMDDRHLIVEFKTLSPQTAPDLSPSISPAPISTPHNCLSCGVTSCFRSQVPDLSIQARTGYLVDDCWAEFDRYIQTVRTGRDRLYLPIDGRKFRKQNYSWNTTGFDKTLQQWGLVLNRAYKSRRLARQGASRQRELMAQSRQLALKYGETLSPEITHLVIAQSLLPWLWEGGYLGGRTFDVLLTTLPIQYLQERLDLAAKSYPNSSTLGDFRAPIQVAELEMAALNLARKIITPHSDLAKLFPAKTELLDWVMPTPLDLPKLDLSQTRPTIVLPCSSLGRKGIYELRSAMAGIDLNLIIVGSELEDPEFWSGYAILYRRGSANEYTQDYHYALQRAKAIVLPAWVEHQPRRLLQAIQEGIPTIVSHGCGLEHIAGVNSIAIGDISALREAILTAIEPIDRNIRHEISLK